MSYTNAPTAGPNRDLDNGQFATTRRLENIGGTLARGATPFPRPSPQHRSLNHVPPVLLDKIPAPLPGQTFRDGRPITDRTDFATAFDDQFHILDSYESLFGAYERSPRHLIPRDLQLGGIDKQSESQPLDIRSTLVYFNNEDREYRLKAWIGVNREDNGITTPANAEYTIEDQALAEMAVRFDAENLHQREQMRLSIKQGLISPWAILSATPEQARLVDERSSEAANAAPIIGTAHRRLTDIQDALERIDDNRPMKADWALEVGLEFVRVRGTAISKMEEFRAKRSTALGVEVTYLLNEEQAQYEIYSRSSRKLRDILGLEEMAARTQMQRLIEANEQFNRYTWESGFPGAYGTAPRLNPARR